MTFREFCRDYLGLPAATIMGFMHMNTHGAVFAHRKYKDWLKAQKNLPKDSATGNMAPTKRGKQEHTPKHTPKKRKAGGHATSKRILFGQSRRASGPYHKKRRTTKKSKIGSSLMISQHNDLSLQIIKNCLRGAKHSFKTLGRFRFYEARNGGMYGDFSTEGLQYVSALPNLATRQQLIGATSNLRASTSTWDTDPFQLNPFVVVPDSNLYPNASAAVAADDKLLLATCHHHMNIINMENIPQTAIIHWYLAKRDNYYNPPDIWNNCVAAQNLTQAAAVGSALIATTTETPGGMSLGRYGADPEEYREFKKHYKCIAKHQVCLQPGDQQNLKLVFKWNKLINKTLLNLLPDSYAGGATGGAPLYQPVQFIKGITICPMIILRAGLVGVRPSSGVLASEVTYGPTRVGVLCNNEWVFKALPVARISTSRQSTGYLVGNVNNGTQNLSIINDVDATDPIRQS